jgi:hypothetical protein
MNPRLKKAVESEPVPAHLEMRVRASLRTATEPTRNPWHWPIAVTAAMAVLAVGFFALHRQENSYIATLSKSITSTMQVGFGDHLHCTILRKQRDTPKPLAEMKTDLGPEYVGLIPAVQAHVPRNYQVLDAHRCHFQGREFVHLVMNLGDRFVSVVVAHQKPGEGFSTAHLVPALAQSGISFYQQGTGAYQIAGFESAQHLVYVISDLPQEQNRQLMIAMAGDLKRALPAL